MRQQKLIILIGAVVALTFLLYVRTASYDFVAFDDPNYVYENPHLQQGLTGSSIAWALTTGYFTYWHPLTWLAYLSTISLFGVSPGPLHLLSAALHAGSAGILLYILHWMTGSTWRAALATALFAWHPLRVESVAWIAELKDVLSTFLWLLATLTYVRYVEKQGAKRYALVLLLFALGLAAKPTLVMFPATLFLLDYWPLRRFPTPDRALLRRIVLEKLPMFVMAGLAGIATVHFQTMNHAAQAMSVLPLGLRVQNAAASIARYLRMFVWPTNLAFFYPHPAFTGISVTTAATIGVLLLVSITVVAVALRRSMPYLLWGWLWFLLVLLPVLGLFQVGAQAMADRFTYVPSIGLCVAVIWLGADLARRLPSTRPLLMTFAGVALAACMIATTVQLKYWQNSETVFNRALEVTQRNYVAENGAGNVLSRRGDVDGAMLRYRASLDIQSVYPPANANVAKILQARGQLADAERYYRVALAGEPWNAPLHNNLANLLADEKRTAEAVEEYQRAIAADPNFAPAHHNLAITLAAAGDVHRAIAQWREAIRIDPNYVAARSGLAAALNTIGDTDGAIVQYRLALRSPGGANDPRVLADFAWLIVTRPASSKAEITQAANLASRAIDLTRGGYPPAQDAFAAALARLDRFDEAVKFASEARDRAASSGASTRAAEIDARVKLYQSHRAYVTTAPSRNPTAATTQAGR